MARAAVRTAAAAAALGLLVLPAAGPADAATTTPTTPAVRATTPAGPPAVPAQPPRCANAIQVVVGTATSPPTPLPRPTSAVGGAALSAPGVQVSVPPGAAQPPVLPAAAWVVADATTGAVVASCNAHVPFMPASTIKILTALALEAKVDPRSTYVALAADAQSDGTKVGLSPGSTYTGDDLWHGLLMASGNDAAHALADLAGGPTASAELMAAEARRLGALDTVPVNTSGLDAPGQVTSAYDLALLGRAALARPYLAKIMTTRTYAFPGKGIGNGKARKRFQIQNHNRLLGSYTGATGVKNGYTVKAGGSFVGAATRGGRSYVVTVLRADGRTSEMARQLLDWAFATAPTAQPVGRLVSPEDVAAGRLGDGGTPGATLSPGATPTSPGAVTPTLGQVTTPPTAPSSTALPTLGTDTGTAGATADAWAAGVVLGAVAAFSLVSAVLVLRRARQRQAEGDTIVPGLLLRRLGGRGKPGADRDAEKGDGGEAPAGEAVGVEDAGAKDAEGKDAEGKDKAREDKAPTDVEPTGPTVSAVADAAPTREPTSSSAGADAAPGKAFPELEGLGLSDPGSSKS